MEATQIGTVEVKRLKIYPLDGQIVHQDLQLGILVEPGVYGLWRFGFTTFWIPAGKLNTRNIRLGDGAFIFRPGDEALEGPTFSVPTRLMGEDEYAQFKAEALSAGLIIRED